MKKLILFFCILQTSLVESKGRADSLMPFQVHIAPHLLINKEAELNLYTVKNRVAYGLNATSNSLFRVKSGSTRLFDDMKSIYLVSGIDIRIDKVISISTLAGLGYVRYRRINLHEYFPPETIQTYFGPIHKKGYYNYDRTIKNIIGLKLNGCINFHLAKHFAVQFGFNFDLNKYMKKPDMILGLKWNIGKGRSGKI